MRYLLAIGLMLALVFAGCTGTNASSQKTSTGQQGTASNILSGIDTSNCLKCVGTYEVTSCNADLSCMTDNYSSPDACKQIVGKIKRTTTVSSRNVNKEESFTQDDVNICLLQIAIRDGNVELCKEITNQDVVNNCYLEIAIRDKNAELCKETTAIANCVKQYAARTNDSEACIKQLENTDRLDCVVQQVGVTDTKSTCDLLNGSDKDLWIECYHKTLTDFNCFKEYPSVNSPFMRTAVCNLERTQLSVSLFSEADVCKKLYYDANPDPEYKIESCYAGIAYLSK